MGQVVVTIAGRTFRLACEDGDEGRLTDLARTFDATVNELRGSFGEVGDTRLAVMAGLVMTDRLGDAQAHVERLTTQVAELNAALSVAHNAHAGEDDKLRQKLDSLSQRLENVTQSPPASHNAGPQS